ncbi:hypothetical protein TIFTF001_003187 [Ficus carica]|uniref:Beta-carotene isomerase D27-like C-terminal domain-containing protein n=1 Tax=Ficus carica TaxID=3494 RepID=A0AA87ZER2_FICCA|nr:hypothetical protein TIFTF001_003187 [Ficus carica]
MRFTYARRAKAAKSVAKSAASSAEVAGVEGNIVNETLPYPGTPNSLEAASSVLVAPTKNYSLLIVVLSLPTVRFTPQHLTLRYKPNTTSYNNSNIRCGIAEPSGEPASFGEKTKYNNGFFDRALMMFFVHKMEKFASPVKAKEKKWLWEYDYGSLVDVSKRVMQGRSRLLQREVVREVLLSMMPPGAPAQVDFRKLFPPTKWTAEFNAAFTIPFFHWLVGPSEVIQVEVNGVKQRSGVRIKKCRYLENSGCVGMCLNMCKIPTQDFFTNEFGLPLTMIQNFEDMSCELVYSQVPSPFEEDEVSKQPCFSEICSMANSSSSVCHKLQA